MLVVLPLAAEVNAPGVSALSDRMGCFHLSSHDHKSQ